MNESDNDTDGSDTKVMIHVGMIGMGMIQVKKEKEVRPDAGVHRMKLLLGHLHLISTQPTCFMFAASEMSFELSILICR